MKGWFFGASGSAGCRLLETSTVAADSEGDEAMVINKERFEAIKVLKAQGWTVSRSRAT